MKPSNWTSTYQIDYRNQTDQPAKISPNAGEPMYHFPDHYDPSHNTKDVGYYGLRSSLSASARGSCALPPNKGGPVGQGIVPSTWTQQHRDNSFYAPSQRAAMNSYFAFKQGDDARYGASSSSSSANAGATNSFSSTTTTTISSLYNPKDLWNHPTVPHLAPREYYNEGDINAIQSSVTITTRNEWEQNGSASARNAASSRFNSSDAKSGSAGYYDAAFVSSNDDEYRLSNHGVAQSKNVDLTRVQEPRNKYHIPGYGGFVHGKQFLHGETFAKTTRACLDVPLDLPAEL